MNKSIIRLQTEYRQYIKDPNYFFIITPNPKNFLIWDVLLIGPPETIFEGGQFKCELIFNSNYPNEPPQFKFLTKLFHPNIYPDGKVCISILHTGNDEFGYEDISERWNPSHSAQSILISILSMLSDPNLESPANVDAAKMWKNDWVNYKKIIYQTISKLI